MQRQRGKMVLMPESFEIDRASSSSAAALDQQHCWNDETHFSGFMHPLSGIPFTSSVNHEQRNVSAWGLGEASSSSGPYRSSNSEWKVENEWPSTVGRHSLRIEDRFGMSSGGMLSLDNSSIGPMFIQGSGSSSTPPSVNSNGVYVGPSEENPSLMECSNLYKSSGSVNNQRPIHPGNEVHPFIPSGSTGFVVEESDVRLGGSLDSRRVPCKRKSFEGHAGQSFIENPNCPQPMESSPWQGTPPCFSMSSGPSTQPLQEQFGPGLCLDLAGGAVPQGLPNMEGGSVSHRNFRLRVNSLDQNDPRPISLSSAIVGAAGNPVATSAPQTSSRLLAANRSLELPPPTAMSGPASDGLQPSLQVPVVAPGGHFIRWNRGLVPRNNTSTSSPILSDEASSSSLSRNMLYQQPMFVSNLSSSSTRGLMRAPLGSSSSVAPPGSSNSAAPLGSSSSAAPQLSHHGSSRQPNHPHSRYPRRLSEYVRRQLLSSIGSDLVGGQSNHTSNSSGHPMLSQDVLLSSAPGSSGHRQSLSRPALRMERQGDSVIGIPYPVRTLTASSERRRRFASELRNVLELVRRGEGGFRVEDVMILDPSMFFGVADIHDRHRDMRLDVDNMSYEELLALEERMGNVCTGLNEETILSRMKHRKYADVAKTQMESEPCCICQEEYNEGEYIGTLECGHDFHRDCIKQWLMHKNLCPICKLTGLTT